MIEFDIGIGLIFHLENISTTLTKPEVSSFPCPSIHIERYAVPMDYTEPSASSVSGASQACIILHSARTFCSESLEGNPPRTTEDANWNAIASYLKYMQWYDRASLEEPSSAGACVHAATSL